jgi:tetratricopeptide (TPR) repeat protein
MPPTIHVLLAARIERLRPEDRSVLERAAVIGRQFSRAAVAHLLGAAPDLDAHLEALRRSELIETDTGWFLGEPALRFHHVLIRDAAYRRVLKDTRAVLHERFADWVVARAGDSNEHDETIGWHLEQAHQNLRELGALDAHGHSLGERAARHLGAAGRRALARDDLGLAASVLGRAIERLERDDPARADLALDWCEALLASGEVGAAAGAVVELGRLAAGSERLAAWHACFAGQLAALTDPQSLRATAGDVAHAATVLAAAGDAAGEAKAHSVHAGALARLGEVGACETALDLALAAARRARDRRRSNAVLAGAPVAALWGPSPVTRASGRCLDVVRVLRITQGAPAVEAVALRCQAVLETLRGRTDAARRMIAASRAMVEELGLAQQLLESDVFAGLIELLEGDAETAEVPLRRAYEGLRERGLGIDAARAAALLGRALLAQGRAAEAEELSHESEALGGDDLKAAIAWRGVRAEALALRGESEEAVELARAAVAIASATDALLDHADARLALATALRAAGRIADADAEETRAADLWETKGATLLVERTGAGATPADAARAATPTPRSVRSNFATLHAHRLDALIAARNSQALRDLFVESIEVIHHTMGASYGRDAAVQRFAMAIDGGDALVVAHEPLATLGDALGLFRVRLVADRFESESEALATGAFEIELAVVIEANAEGRALRGEIFAAERLAEAVARMYQRLAELEPAGAMRDAAATRARCVAAILALDDGGDFTELVGADVAAVDHRVLGFGVSQGAEAVRNSMRALHDLASEVSVRVDDVLALERDCLLLRSTTLGVDRAGGGRFERPMLQIRVFGADGRMTRNEWFETDREAAALARFKELTRPTAPAPRRVRPNAATANIARLDAAMAARDLAQVESVFAADFEGVHHPLRTRFGRDGALASLDVTLGGRDLVFRNEPIATLGDALALSLHQVAASGLVHGAIDVGAVDFDGVWVIETDRQGRRLRGECFAGTEIAAAITRLYERHAELSPEGPERDHAAATARTVAIGLTPSRPLEEWVAADVAFHDRRRIGLGSVRGLAAMSRGAWSRLALASDLAIEVQDVLALGPRGFLLAWTTRGTQREGGGRFENHLLMLRVFEASGLARVVEWFDVDDAAAAVARFEELTAPAAAERRVAQNAATACAAALVTAVAAGDLDAVATRVAEHSETIHHPSGASWGTEGALASWRMLMEGRDAHYDLVPHATLGGALGLFLQSARASGPALDDADDYELDHWLVLEVDAAQRMMHAELFAHDRLRDALICLYERHAEHLPAGRDRERAATTARCVAGLLRSEPSLVQASNGGETEFQDHRRLGLLRSGRVSASDVASYRDSFAELTEDVSVQVDELLCVRPDAFLVRSTTRGRDRRSGGSFEQPKLDLRCFDATGRLLRGEWFDVDREADALARFDELTQEISAPPIENAATRAARAVVDAIRAQRIDSLDALFAEDLRSLSHETGVEMTRDEMLTRARYAIEHGVELRFDLVPVAALGEHLALHRMHGVSRAIADAELPAGETEVRALTLGEITADGRLRRLEQFADSQPGRALARLYQRWAETAPEAERARASIVARAVAALSRPPDLEALAPLLAPDVECADHRMFGMGTARGAQQYLSAVRTLLDTTLDLHNRDEILAADESTLVVRREGNGTLRQGGGTFVQSMILLRAFGADGRITHIELFDTDREVDALARRAELVAGPPAEPFGNAAWHAILASNRAWRERRWDDVVAAYHPDYELTDHRSVTGVDLRGGDFLRNLRLIFDTPGSVWQTVLLATRGERHALVRARLVAELPDRGRVEWEHLGVTEFDAQGRRKSMVLFDTDHLDAAYAELHARFAAGEGAPHAALLATLAELARAWCAYDRAALERVAHESFTVTSHRRVRIDETRDRAGWIMTCTALEEMGVDSAVRVDHLRVSPRAVLCVGAVQGTRDGGAFELPIIFVYVHDGSRLLSQDLYDGDQIDEARARFAEIATAVPVDPLARWLRPNAAVTAHRRSDAAFHARDWSSMRASFAPDAFIEERRAGLRTPPHDADTAVASLRDGAAAVPNLRVDHELFATFGDRVALERQIWRGGTAGAEIEIEMLTLNEADAEGRIAALVSFDPGDVVAACREASERWIAIEPHLAPILRAGFAYGDATRNRDAAALRALVADDFVVDDRRRAGLGQLAGGDALVASFQAVWQLTRTSSNVVRARLATEPWGSVLISHVTGTLADGGAFEGLSGALTVFETDASSVSTSSSSTTSTRRSRASRRCARSAAIRCASRRTPRRAPMRAGAR